LDTKPEEVQKPWVTDEMTDMMEERMKQNSIQSEEGRKNVNPLHNHLRKITDKATEKWWDEQCAELDG